MRTPCEHNRKCLQKWVISGDLATVQQSHLCTKQQRKSTRTSKVTHIIQQEANFATSFSLSTEDMCVAHAVSMVPVSPHLHAVCIFRVFCTFLLHVGMLNPWLLASLACSLLAQKVCSKSSASFLRKRRNNGNIKNIPVQ